MNRRIQIFKRLGKILPIGNDKMIFGASDTAIQHATRNYFQNVKRGDGAEIFVRNFDNEHGEGSKREID